MTEYPTIRIKCAEGYRERALWMANNGLRLKVGEGSTDTIQGFKRTARGRETVLFDIYRDKEGVSVRQIVDGRAV